MKILKVLFLFTFLSARGQDQLSFNGFWRNNSDTRNYYVVKNDSILFISKYDDLQYLLNIYFFNNKKITDKTKSSAGFSFGMTNGTLIPEIENNQVIAFEIANQNIHSFSRVSSLPLDYEQHVYSFGKTTKRDLIKEFNIQSRITITTPKSFFFQDASEAKPKKSFLLKGDIAFVEETKGDWLFIRFEGKTITRGWMHKKNVQYLK